MVSLVCPYAAAVVVGSPLVDMLVAVERNTGPEVAVECVVGQQHLQDSATGVVDYVRQRIRGLVRADVSCSVVRVLAVVTDIAKI